MAGSAPGLLRATQPGVELLGRDVFWGRVLASVEGAYAPRSMLSRVLLETKRQSGGATGRLLGIPRPRRAPRIWSLVPPVRRTQHFARAQVLDDRSGQERGRAPGNPGVGELGEDPGANGLHLVLADCPEATRAKEPELSPPLSLLVSGTVRRRSPHEKSPPTRSSRGRQRLRLRWMFQGGRAPSVRPIKSGKSPHCLYFTLRGFGRSRADLVGRGGPEPRRVFRS